MKMAIKILKNGLTREQTDYIHKLFDKYNPMNGFSYEELQQVQNLYTKTWRALNQCWIKEGNDPENKELWMNTANELADLKRKFKERYYKFMVDVYESQCCWSGDEVESLAYLETEKWDI